MSQLSRFSERIVERLGGVTQRQLSDIRRRAYEAGYSDGGEDEPPSGDLKKQGYRTASSQGLRDFTTIDHARVLEIVWSLFQNNPVAGRSLEIKTAYIVGSGTRPKIGDTKLKDDVIVPFWTSNKIPQRISQWVKQLYLWGEQCYPVFVRKSDGRVRLGYIDPAEIEDIICDPGNSMERWAVVTKSMQSPTNRGWIRSRDKRIFRIVRLDESTFKPLGTTGCPYCGAAITVETFQCPNCEGPTVEVNESAHEGKYVTADQATFEPWETEMLRAFDKKHYDGSCLLVQVNNVSNQSRGWSDLLGVADWMDQHDSTLYAVGERERLASYFGWDVTCAGADDDKIRERAKDIRNKPPRKGTVNVHNDKETWLFNYPDLKQSGSTEAAKEILTHVLGGLGFPKHWYGYGDETNRATAQAQGDPTWRTLECDQFDVHSFLRMMLEFVRDQAEIAGYWCPDDSTDVDVDVELPEMTMRDLGTLSSAISQIITALGDAVDKKFLTIKKAREIWAKVLGELGIPVDAAEEATAIDEAEGLKQKGVVKSTEEESSSEEAPPKETGGTSSTSPSLGG